MSTEGNKAIVRRFIEEVPGHGRSHFPTRTKLSSHGDAPLRSSILLPRLVSLDMLMVVSFSGRADAPGIEFSDHP
jgi:hypothetical protein